MGMSLCGAGALREKNADWQKLVDTLKWTQAVRRLSYLYIGMNLCGAGALREKNADWQKSPQEALREKGIK
jgi:hypothetical protein